MIWAMSKALNLLRTAAGIRDLDHLKAVMKRRLVEHKGQTLCMITTRRKPTRDDEILKTGGSIYWICQRMIQVRQKIVDFEMGHDDQGRGFCMIFLDPELILTNPLNKKPVQGWRYLKGSDAPSDLGEQQGDISELPAAMVRDLKKLGLL